ncbi:DUF4097 family beta strand repeat-containing protein [Robiginitalea sp. SC105]|uniref:DUF4097 family beta strand repeat-containing protein n=1 Tax=Robiginitalea sp. SC105 TaxID=2762332 RepID=UPI00163A8391|nr:DUF4097 family beta strand repeat-containing protein [Robiginitalea sp. SC105]MBC2840197.1 DUF4097 family beta strand repeat protein [Robiginitalea sp. SC105]
MRRMSFKIIPLFLALVTCLGPARANDPELRGRHTKEKTIKKEFNVNSDALLKIDNSFGNLVLTSWNENRVVIEVHITTNGNNEDKVQNKLEEITVEFEASASMVSARTRIGKDNSWGWWGKNNNVNMQINYTVRMPVKNSVNLSNDYGNISLDRLDGHARISCDYGRLDLGELRGRNNELSFDYTSKSRIGFMNSGKIRADYSGFVIEKAGDLDISADYTDSAVEQMENLTYSSDYGNLDVGEANNIRGSGDYINVKLGTIHGDVDITADYGSIRIERMAQDAGDINIRTDYTGIKIGYDPAYHFNFEISSEYAGVSGKEDFTINVSREKNSSRYYQGYYGSSSSGNSVNITSEYGNISFNRQ